MALQFCSLASGSSGNCYLVKSESTTLLIDLGIAGKRVFAGLDQLEIPVEAVDGILITHEHIDHVKSLNMIGKKAINATVYTSKGTMEAMKDKIPADRSRQVAAQEEFSIGDIQVTPFHLSHDAAEPLGYSFAHHGRKITIVTDTGYISEEIYNHIEQCNLLVLEANHEVNILKMGSYPYNLKRRILGDLGHLSNEAAGECICRLINETKSKEKIKVILAHLSKENNTPGQAYLTIRNMLFDEDLFIDKNLDLDIVNRDQLSALMEV